MNTRIDRRHLLIGTYILDTYARTEKHVRELKECGIDLVVCLRSPSRELLDLLQKYGMGCVLSGVVPGWWGGDGENAGQLAVKNPISKYAEGAATFVDHPAVWMIDIGDEPSAKDFDHYGKVAAAMEALFPNQLPYLNLYPNYASVAVNSASETLNQLGTVDYATHIREYVRKVGLPYISYDFYVYPMGPDGIGKMYENYRIVADACRETGRDFWFIPQCNGRWPTDFTSANQMRFQAFSALCYGAVAINWACWTAGWWCNNILDKDGNKTEQYDKLQAVNAELRRLGTNYMDYRSVGTHLLGFEAVPPVRDNKALEVAETLDLGFVRGLRGEAAFNAAGDTQLSPNLVVGEFVDRDDPARHALLILNATDYTDSVACPVRVRFATHYRNVSLLYGPEGTELSRQPAANGSYDADEYCFELPNAQAALIRIF